MKEEYMPKTLDQKLGKLVEECGEVLAAVGKTQRWGLDSSNPELPPEQQETNRDWILRELQDLKESIDIVEKEISLKYHGYSVSEIIDMCRADGACNNVIKNKNLVHLLAEILRWDKDIDRILMNPLDFNNEFMSDKNDFVPKKNGLLPQDEEARKSFSTPIFTDISVPVGVVVCVAEEYTHDEYGPSINFAIMDLQ